MGINNKFENVYIKRVIEIVPQIIGSLDRNVISGTCGCFDRQYWAWKLKDIPNASLQYGVYFLSLLWDCRGSVYYRNGQLLSWIRGAVEFWMSIQHKNGSFDQCYPWEYSVGTTAYTLISMLKTKEMTGSLWDKAFVKNFDEHIKQAADYFSSNEEMYGEIANHTALFAYANLLLADNYGKKFKDRYAGAIEKLGKLQNKEGWFVEYEGPDPCYQTQNVHYMVECFRKTGDKKLLEMLKHSISNYLIYCFHPDGTIGGAYGSRNTEIYYPAGFEMIGNEVSDAKTIAKWMRKSLDEGRTLTPKDLDIENSIRLAVNYLLAATALEGQNEDASCESFVDMKWVGNGNERYFEKCRQFFKSGKNYYAVIGAGKGGVVKIFNTKEEKLIYEDDGYLGIVDGMSVTTQRWQNAECKKLDNSFECTLKLYKIDENKMDATKFFILRVMALLVRWNNDLRDFLKKKLAKKLILSKKEIKDCYVVRNFKFEENKVVIEDQLVSKNKGLNISLKTLRIFNPIHMASAGYYNNSHLREMKAVNLNNDNPFSKMEISCQ